jgi:LAO/AO transport system kinase
VRLRPAARARREHAPLTAAPGTLAERLRSGDPVAISRAISLVENTGPGFDALLAELQPMTGRAHRIGVTGPPGAGKSTLTQTLVRHWREDGHRVAVVAVDPTSPRTGGALLGDRIRMEGVALDEGVYIRSMATRGALGGLAVATREVCDVLDAAGYDRIVIETVGVGQAELDVAAAADTTVLVLVPESGDGIQTLKAGLMEVADLFVVNKADRPGADRLVNDIQVAFAVRAGRAYGPERPPADDRQWRPPVLATVATEGTGVDQVAGGVAQHRAWLEETGELGARRRARLAAQLRDVVARAVRRWVWEAGDLEALVAVERANVEAGRATPYAVAEEAVRRVRGAGA